MYQTPNCLRRAGAKASRKGSVEVGDGVVRVEACEERGAVHAIERRGGPIQDFDETERLQMAGVGDLLEQRPQDRRA